MINLLFEASPIDPTTGIATTYRFARNGADSSGTQMNNLAWEPMIETLPVMTMSVFGRGQVQVMQVDHGAIGIHLEPDFYHLSQLVWDGALGRVWTGQTGSDFSTYTKIFDGTLGAHSREGLTLKVPLYGVDFRLNETPLLASSYSGTGGVEGPVSLKGAWRPLAYGSCRYVTPIRVSEAYVVFQVSDGAVADIPAVYENALTLNAPIATVSTYAELIALTLMPGQWATAPAIGMYRLGGEPSGKVTADVVGDPSAGTTLASITAAILSRAGVLPSELDLTSINAVAGSIQWCAFVSDQVNVGELLKAAFAGAGLYLFADETGVMRAGSWLADGATLAASSAGPDLSVVVGSLRQEEAAPPNYSITINAERCWSPHSDSEISPAIVELQEGQQALEDEAQRQADDLATTREDIRLQRLQLDDIAKDSILDTSEKAAVKLDYRKIVVEKPALLSKASSYGVSTVAYLAAFDALTSYLVGLSPAWDDATANTPIVRETFNAAWAGEADARAAVKLAIADATAKLANWPSVSGRPLDLGSLDPTAGVKLGGIETGATVGAPAGTNVAGVPAQTITDALRDALGNIARLRDLKSAIDTQIETANTNITNARNIATSAADKITQEIQDRIGADSNLSQRIDSIVAEGGYDDTYLRSEVTTIKAAYADADRTIGQRIDLVVSDLGTANSNINTVSTTASDAKQAVADLTTSVSTRFRETNDFAAGLDSRVTTLSNNAGSTATKIQTLEATTLTGPDRNSLLSARVLSVETATTDGRFATTQRVSGVETAVNNVSGRVNTVETATTDGRFAASSLVNTINSTVGGLSTTVDTQARTLIDLQGKSSAYWSVGANAGNGRAQLTLYASSNGGGGVDILGDVAIRGQTGAGLTIVSNTGVTVFDSNGVMRVRLGIW